MELASEVSQALRPPRDFKACTAAPAGDSAETISSEKVRSTVSDLQSLILSEGPDQLLITLVPPQRTYRWPLN